MVVNESGAAH